MDSERAKRLVSALRARGVMAHLAEVGVYEFGIRVVLDEDAEALWDTDGTAGLDAEVVSDGVLIGYVPHIPGSAEFTEEQIVDAIATATYSEEGLHPPADSDGAPSAPPPLPQQPQQPQQPQPQHRRGHRRWSR
ncbi:hypothetical protein NGB36_02465 [Streptomyces sp. RB6PN25]|uniref:Uncharacterized protein n=1 Tax=Streptomyces humicola TaxID=2953240 RepID=A0ABT1PP93_9ACTN|nr:hypothetical protein [Streptomyces humicola]MCQ4079491.1 hypothetical protein [Streptomyces humicola]